MTPARFIKFLIMNDSIKVGILLLMSLLAGCSTDRVQNTKELAREMNDRKIKRVTSAQLTSTVDEWGKAVVAEAQKGLEAEMAQANPPASLCNPDGSPSVRKLEKLYAADIDLLTARDVKSAALPAKERELLDAYLYNAENKLAQSDNVQKIADTLFVYNAAVPAATLICRTCSDQAALPFVVWRVVFSKKEIIRRLNPKALQKKKA